MLVVFSEIKELHRSDPVRFTRHAMSIGICFSLYACGFAIACLSPGNIKFSMTLFKHGISAVASDLAYTVAQRAWERRDYLYGFFFDAAHDAHWLAERLSKFAEPLSKL